MRRIFSILGLLAFVASANAQVVPQGSLPPNTVVGRTGISAGPAQAIPFSILTTNLLGSLCFTPGAVPVFNGQTNSWQCSTPATGHWFSQNGMLTARLNDNVLVGGATVNDMAFPNVTKDWLSTFQTAAGLPNGSVLSTELAALTQNSSAAANGGVGILGGAQSLFSTSAGTSTIGVSGFAVNNNATLATSAWGFYAECHKTVATVNQCFGFEVEPRSTVATTTPTPFQQGDAVGLQLGCGAGLAASQDCSAGIQTESNPNKFKKGIVFGDTSLTAGGTGGNGFAIDFSRNQSVRWANNGPGTDVELWGNASGLNLSVPLVVGSGGTGVNTNTSNGILFGNGGSAIGSNRCTMDSGQSVACTSATAFLPQFSFTNTTSDANSAFFLFKKNRSGGNTNNADAIGQLVFQGFSNAAQQNSAAVRAIQNAASSGNNVPSRLELATSSAAGQLNQTITFDQNAHIDISSQATATSVTTCGTGTLGTGSNDTAGTATATGATACTITFGAAYASHVHCVASDNTTANALKVALTLSAITITGLTSGDTFSWICMGQ